ncbi:hypothetical protein GCM10010402_56920 [Actinomadura luteofluorescens]|uniref:hypothetical protein n=1 Tax=Actinomadura luteofluorescens TaxID=46163 RepID=UPI002164B21F|nr:hypothetical protein [Actinomadura glauciflava]
MPSSPLLPQIPSAPGVASGRPAAAAGFAAPKELPFTGGDALPLVARDLTSIAAGSAAVAATRRRHARNS